MVATAAGAGTPRAVAAPRATAVMEKEAAAQAGGSTHHPRQEQIHQRVLAMTMTMRRRQSADTS